MKTPILLTGLSLIASLAALAEFQVAWAEKIKGTTAIDSTSADVDDDGDLDVCLIHLVDEGTVLLNDGSGVFTQSPTAAPLPAAGAAQLGDLDGDGDPDLFLATHLGPCKVWLNDGSGNFSDSGQSISGSYSRVAVSLADLDGDNDLDVVLPANSPMSGSTVIYTEVWLNDGNGVFTDSGQQLGSAFAQSSTVFDVNGDTFPDIALSINGQNKLWINNGSGVFTLSATQLGGGTTFDIQFADLNGDTFPDAFVADGFNPPFADDNEVWFNDGNGTFTNSGQSLGDGYSFCVVLTDLDNDSDIDAVVGNNTTQPNEVWRNDGTGTFTLAPVTLGINNAIDIEAADFDGDNDTDFFLAINGYPSELWNRVPVNQGGPIKDSGQRFGSSSASCLAQGDFDGDNDIDIAMGNGGGIVRILRNNGAGQFRDTPNPLPNGFGNNNGAIGAGDFNGDNFIDLLVVNNPRGGNADLADRVWFNDGTGRFTMSPQLIGAENGGCVAIADVDGDNDLDAIVGNAPYGFGAGQNRIYRNDGTGTFTPYDALGTGNTRGIAVGLINNDAHVDIVVGSIDLPTTIWFGDGTGNFTDSGQSLGTGNTRAVLLGDFDGSPGLDVLCANSSGGSKLYTNSGSGTFTESAQVFTGNNTTSAAAFDLEGDTDLDLWFGRGFFSNPDQLWTNDGSGSFVLETPTYGSQTTEAVIAADFNGDGDMDIFVASQAGDHILWAQGAAAVQAYAESFGLTGTDTEPFEDPDLDGVSNYEEYAFNMNPNLADSAVIGNFATATKGLPVFRVEVNGSNRAFVAETIQRIGADVIDYRLEAATNLVFGAPPAGITVTSNPFNANYQRTTYRYDIPSPPPAHFGRFRVLYSP
ncbi:VCBS repeat-containing protein [Akkermansiaceae bacterium]|nr:VCBS repeat-containing protein [Akkermansiaceae bacterium]